MLAAAVVAALMTVGAGSAAAAECHSGTDDEPPYETRTGCTADVAGTTVDCGDDERAYYGDDRRRVTCAVATPAGEDAEAGCVREGSTSYGSTTTCGPSTTSLGQPVRCTSVLHSAAHGGPRVYRTEGCEATASAGGREATVGAEVDHDETVPPAVTDVRPTLRVR